MKQIGSPASQLSMSRRLEVVIIDTFTRNLNASLLNLPKAHKSLSNGFPASAFSYNADNLIGGYSRRNRHYLFVGQRDPLYCGTSKLHRSLAFNLFHTGSSSRMASTRLPAARFLQGVSCQRHNGTKELIRARVAMRHSSKLHRDADNASIPRSNKG